MYRADKFYGPERQVLEHLVRFSTARRSGCSGRTAPASRRCCGSWPGRGAVLRVAESTRRRPSGSCSRSPKSTETKDVRSNVEDGVRELRDLLDRFNALSAAFAEPDADFDALSSSRRVSRSDRPRRRLEPRPDARPGDGRAPPPGGRPRRDDTLGRRAAASGALPPAPRRLDLLLLDEPTNHLDAELVAWLERHLEANKGTVIVVTHDRYFLDNVAGWIFELDRGKGIPFQGNYTSWLEQKEARLGVEEKQNVARRRMLQRELEWVRMSPTARHAKSKARLTAYEKLLAEDQAKRLDTSRSTSRPALGWGRGGAGRARSEGLRRPAARRGPDLRPAAGRDRRRDRPNGAGKTTLFRMIAGEETRTPGRSRSATRSNSPTSTSHGAGSRGRAPSGRRFRQRGRDPARQARNQLAPVRLWFNFRGGTSRSSSRTCPGASGTASTLRKLLPAGGNLLLLDEPTNDLDVDTSARSRRRWSTSSAAPS